MEGVLGCKRRRQASRKHSALSRVTYPFVTIPTQRTRKSDEGFVRNFMTYAPSCPYKLRYTYSLQLQDSSQGHSSTEIAMHKIVHPTMLSDIAGRDGRRQWQIFQFAAFLMLSYCIIALFEHSKNGVV